MRMARLEGLVSNPTALSAFHASIDPGTVVGIRLGSSGTGTKKKVARPEGDFSNELFETLKDWEHQLKHAEEDAKRLPAKPKGPQL